MSHVSLGPLSVEKCHKGLDSINVHKGKMHDEILFRNNRQCWPALSNSAVY